MADTRFVIYISAGLGNYLALGMESFRISDLQLTASSEVDADHSASCSRFNHNIRGGAWIPKTPDQSEYLQIDLGWIMILTGIATQGHPEKHYRTLTYQVKHRISLSVAFKNYPQVCDRLFNILIAFRFCLYLFTLM